MDSSTNTCKLWKWAQSAAATSIHHAVTQPGVVHILPRLRRLCEQEDIKVQRWIYGELRKLNAPFLQTFLRERWQQWEHRFRGHVLPSVAVDRALRLVDGIRGRVPPCVKSALLTTWFNCFFLVFKFIPHFLSGVLVFSADPPSSFFPPSSLLPPSYSLHTHSHLTRIHTQGYIHHPTLNPLSHYRFSIHLPHNYNL